MAIKPAAASPQALLRSAITESIEDPVSTERMTKAVTVVPCGHIFNEDTIIQCLARDRLCPLDRQRIERYVPNYNMRRLAETADENALKDEGPTEEAKAHFLCGKELSDQGKYEEAITALLQALQLCPTYDKAQAFLDFCLKSTSKSTSPPPASPLPAISLPVPLSLQAKPSTDPISKTKYTDLLFNLLEESSIQNHPIKKILAIQVKELMKQEAEELTPTQKESYQWTKKLIVDHKVRQFVADELEQIHGKNTPQLERLQAPSPLPAAASPPPQLFSSQIAAPSPVAISTPPPAAPLLEARLLAKPPANPKIPEIAFGKELWAKYLGDVEEEPPLPPDIDKILQSPCPFLEGKRVEETHMLTLIPKTVKGKPLTLDFLNELVKNPKQGLATQYRMYMNEIAKQYGSQQLQKSYWVLMTRDVIPGSRNKSYEEQVKLLKVSYEVPQLLEAATSIFMEYLRTGKKELYSDSPWTYTRCQGRVSQRPKWRLVVGGFAAGGLDVRISDHDSDPRGLGGVRKL